MVGASKRFCLFSSTVFRLPLDQLDFLKVNFGIEGLPPIDLPEARKDDPLFELAIRRYAGQLTDQDFYRLVLDAFGRIAIAPPNGERLRLRYLTEICRVLIGENALSRSHNQAARQRAGKGG